MVKALRPLNALNLPENRIILGAEELSPSPYFTAGYKAFLLQNNFLSPYPGWRPADEGNNQRSLAKRVYDSTQWSTKELVECAFWILSPRWWTYQKLYIQTKTARLTILTAVTLCTMLVKNKAPRANVADTSIIVQQEEGNVMAGLRNLSTMTTSEATDLVGVISSGQSINKICINNEL